MKVDPALGTPKDDVTHWAISRITGWRRNEKQRRVPSYERLTHPRPDGAHLGEWPLDACTLEIIRERWGDGEYRCHWLINDEEAAEPTDRRRSAGNGNIFKLENIPEPEEATVIHLPPTVSAPTDGATAQLDFAIKMMQLADGRTRDALEQASRMHQMRQSDGGGDGALRAELAELRARLDAEKAQREVDERHRAALAAKDEEIRDLKRAKERAEEEADKKNDAAPAFDPDVPIWEQLPIVAINGVMSLAKTHPEVAGMLMEKGVELWERVKSKPGPTVSRETPATGAAPVAAIPRVVQAPSPVHLVPRRDDPLTPSQTARAADPPAPPRPAPQPVITVAAEPAAQ